MIQETLWMARHGKRTFRRTLSLWRKDLAAWRRFWASYKQYCDTNRLDRATLLQHLYPCIGDDTPETEIEPVYFYQDAWAFERIVQLRPASHVDVGSHHKFIALLSKVVPVVMVDIRPLSLLLDTIDFRAGSILEMPFENASIASLSSICVIEHIGLGRYGDPLDPQGTQKALDELKRILAPGGNLYLSVPLDDENRTCFNAHRTFTEEHLMELFKPLEVCERRYIYGCEFCSERRTGFGTGCYHLYREA